MSDFFNEIRPSQLMLQFARTDTSGSKLPFAVACTDVVNAGQSELSLRRDQWLLRFARSQPFLRERHPNGDRSQDNPEGHIDTARAFTPPKTNGEPVSGSRPK